MFWANIISKLKLPDYLAGLKNSSQTECVHKEKEFIRVLEKERERSYRNKHQFSLILFELEMNEIGCDKIHVFLSQIIKRMRMIDEIGWYRQKCIGIILPYTSAYGAKQFTNSLGDLTDSSVPISTCTIYTYPSAYVSNNYKQEKIP